MDDEVTKPMKALDLELLSRGPAFDVARVVAGGRDCEWSFEQFKEVPLLDRVRLLAGGQVKFYKQGVEIPAREALKGL